MDAFDDWKKLPNTKLRPNGAISLAQRFDGDCYHALAIDAGMLWDMDEYPSGPYYRKTAEHRGIRRVRLSDGTYDFEIDMRLVCHRTHDHYFTWSLTGSTERLFQPPLRLAAHLRPFSIADWETAGPALGIRQNAESTFGYLKDYIGLGRRAGSYSALAHEIDILLVMMIHNALVWAEYRQKYQ